LALVRQNITLLVGSRDRKLIKDKIYEVVRHRGMLLKLSKGELDFNRMIDLLDSNEFKDQRKNPSFEEYSIITSDMSAAVFQKSSIPE